MQESISRILWENPVRDNREKQSDTYLLEFDKVSHQLEFII